MEIQWNDNLATGVEKIDDQHKEIFRRVNRLINLSEEEKKMNLRKCLDF